jgi:hypothetical protein
VPLASCLYFGILIGFSLYSLVGKWPLVTSLVPHYLFLLASEIFCRICMLSVLSLFLFFSADNILDIEILHYQCTVVSLSFYVSLTDSFSAKTFHIYSPSASHNDWYIFAICLRPAFTLSNVQTSDNSYSGARLPSLCITV